MGILFLSALVTALTQVAKKTLNINKRYIPVTAILIAFIIMFVYIYFSSVKIEWIAIQNALIAGLGSVGLWEIGTKTIGK